MNSTSWLRSGDMIGVRPMGALLLATMTVRGARERTFGCSGEPAPVLEITGWSVPPFR